MKNTPELATVTLSDQPVDETMLETSEHIVNTPNQPQAPEFHNGLEEFLHFGLCDEEAKTLAEHATTVDLSPSQIFLDNFADSRDGLSYFGKSKWESCWSCPRLTKTSF